MLVQRRVLSIERRRCRSAKDPRGRLGLIVDQYELVVNTAVHSLNKESTSETSSCLCECLGLHDLQVSPICRQSAATDGALLPSKPAANWTSLYPEQFLETLVHPDCRHIGCLLHYHRLYNPLQRSPPTKVLLHRCCCEHFAQ